MCWINGLYLSMMIWHNSVGVSVEDRTRTCAYTHESRFYNGETYEIDTFSIRHKVKLRKGLYLMPSFNLGIENHKFSDYYNDTYITAYPSVKASAKITRGIYLDTNINLGKGFYTINENSNIEAPSSGYAPSTSFSIGITMSTDKIFGKTEKKKVRKKKHRRKR